MNILVTGGAGFIGSHLIEALLARGDRVTVLDNFDDGYDPAIKEQNIAGAEVQLIHGDIRDRAAVETALRGVDAVVHLAARAGVRSSLANPGEYASVNVGGTVNLLEALRDRDRVPFVFASSSSVYGSRTDGPFVETDPTDWPASPYAGTKRAAELMCLAAHQSWGQQVTALRFFTVYGPRQRPGMAIEKFVRLALTGQSIPMFGDGASARDYTFVDDAVRSVLAALAHPQDFEVINVGGGNPVRLDALIAAVGRVVGVDVSLAPMPDQPGDVPLTWADAAKAQQLLHWVAEVSLDEGLCRYVEWVRAQLPR